MFRCTVARTEALGLGDMSGDPMAEQVGPEGPSAALGGLGSRGVITGNKIGGAGIVAEAEEEGEWKGRRKGTGKDRCRMVGGGRRMIARPILVTACGGGSILRR